MPKGKDVKHGKWSNDIILFDDCEYSAIWGNYENSPKKRLGVRWNGQDSKLGFPNKSNHPVWFVEREYLEKPILLELLSQVLKYPSDETPDYIKNIQQALKEV